MRTIILVGWLAASAGPTHAAECPEPASIAAVQARLDDAATSYGRLDVAGFDAALDDVAFALPCLSEPATPELAGRLHRFQGLRQFVAREDERAAQAFAAARSADGADLPGDLVPEGHAARALYGRIPLDNARYEPVPEPKRGWLTMDGRKATERPTTWPTLVQVHDGGGEVRGTAYLFPGDPMPEYDAWPLPVAALGRPPRKPPPVALIAGTSAAAVAAGTPYRVAGLSAAGFEDDHPEWDDDALQAHRRRTNGLVVASAATAGLAAVGVGLSFGIRW